MPSRRSYPSDISEARWRLISPLIDERQERGRKRSTELRDIINAINYRWSTGCTWRMLPHDFPPWETVYTYFDRWRRQGKLGDVREIILRRSPYVSDERSRERAKLKKLDPDASSNDRSEHRSNAAWGTVAQRQPATVSTEPQSST